MMLFGSFSSSFSFAPSTRSLKSSRDSEGTTPGGKGVEGLEVAAIVDSKGGGAGFELAQCACAVLRSHTRGGASLGVAPKLGNLVDDQVVCKNHVDKTARRSSGFR